MENNFTNNKLDDKIKDVLNNYTAEFDASDWTALEKKLTNTSSGKSFRVDSKILMRSLIVAGALGIGVLAFYLIDQNSKKTSSEQPKNEVIKNTPVQTENNTPQEIAQPPVVLIDSTNIVPTDTLPVANEEADVTAKPEKAVEEKISDTKPIAKENKPAKEAKKETKKEKGETKKTAETTTAGKEDEKPEKIFIMGNEPVFGDMIDSGKGITNKTKESEETKKSAQEKGIVPVGWDAYMLQNVNPDSIRKNRALKDTIQ